jgi:hypothetical protein
MHSLFDKKENILNFESTFLSGHLEGTAKLHDDDFKESFS